MEDSFRVRAERAFGSLPIPASSSLNSLWSLTEDEIQNTPSNRTPKPKPKPKTKPQSQSYSFSSSRVQLEKDLNDFDDDEEEEPRGPSKPPDYDDEQWQIKAGIGRDCTLDYEEEEDQYDKQAIGKENLGDRLYMKDINDDGVEISSCNVFPTSFRDLVRDPRANHLAARIRLKQDDEAAAKKIDALHVSEKSAPDIGSGGDAVNPKSILRSKDNPSEPRPQKRVRFDSECDDRGNDDVDGHEGTRDVRMKTSSMEEDTASDQLSKSQEFDSAVPDYIRNPSRYTRYTFDDSPSDMDDKSNKEACMSFLSQLKGSNAAKGTGSQADEALEDLPSVTFISKKKSGDANMCDSETVPKPKLDAGMEAMNRRAFPVGIAAGDSENSDACAMEEDEPEVEVVKKSLQKLNRQYRKKAQEEPV
ncbi:hypothetical protein JHK84_053082 [Glycine max]|uniref:U5 small nuclear ribonucleoprotein TSSC4 n=1 Tax=Glycine soja TaxID=3848 RepID=A0A445FEM4_GLYSO|nr:uncharacterized protein LOC114400590 [Glycine soja]KAG4912622.1 hypothetical protein JHK86_053055 [Glycine max]KAG5083044.1 hypothetical protein JHK84_053082 [Glycine max]KHN28590.1 hypothetical protein glysoja_021411 [Glycine soja]RZB47296.1 hypothetical protein D0Y65_051075 [Glycine soja]